MTVPNLVVGFGSEHGDDQVGWLVARELAQRQLPGCETRWAETPSKLLSWLDGRAKLICCDACSGLTPEGVVRRWEWPAADLMQLEWSGTHDLNLPAVLLLCEKLRWLPPSVIVLGVGVSPPKTATKMSELVIRSVPMLAKYIESELIGNKDVLEEQQVKPAGTLDEELPRA